jgi:hypothetical protein
MKEPITSYVGLDIHKESIAIAIAKAGRDAPQFIGTTVAQLAQVRKVLTHQKCAPDKTLVVYHYPRVAFLVRCHLLKAASQLIRFHAKTTRGFDQVNGHTKTCS